MNTNERNQENTGRQENNQSRANQPTSQTNHNPTSQSNVEKQWDVKPGHEEADPRKQQENREWQESQKQQHQNAQNPGVGGGGDQYENDRNQDPTRRDGGQEEE